MIDLPLLSLSHRPPHCYIPRPNGPERLLTDHANNRLSHTSHNMNGNLNELGDGLTFSQRDWPSTSPARRRPIPFETGPSLAIPRLDRTHPAAPFSSVGQRDFSPIVQERGLELRHVMTSNHQSRRLGFRDQSHHHPRIRDEHYQDPLLSSSLQPDKSSTTFSHTDSRLEGFHSAGSSSGPRGRSTAQPRVRKRSLNRYRHRFKAFAHAESSSLADGDDTSTVARSRRAVLVVQPDVQASTLPHTTCTWSIAQTGLSSAPSADQITALGRSVPHIFNTPSNISKDLNDRRGLVRPLNEVDQLFADVDALIVRSGLHSPSSPLLSGHYLAPNSSPNAACHPTSIGVDIEDELREIHRDDHTVVFSTTRPHAASQAQSELIQVDAPPHPPGITPVSSETHRSLLRIGHPVKPLTSRHLHHPSPAIPSLMNTTSRSSSLSLLLNKLPCSTRYAPKCLWRGNDSTLIYSGGNCTSGSNEIRLEGGFTTFSSV